MTRAALLALALAAGCAHPPPRAPSAEVRAEVAAAETAERARRHDQARAHYQRAVARAGDAPSLAFARREYADTLISWGELPEAIAQLEGVVVSAPHDAATWHDLGILRHHRGDDLRAITALERARTLSPADPRPRIALAALRWKRGDRVGARAEYTALLELDLPERVRGKVTWALGALVRPAH